MTRSTATRQATEQIASRPAFRLAVAGAALISGGILVGAADPIGAAGSDGDIVVMVALALLTIGAVALVCAYAIVRRQFARLAQVVQTSGLHDVATGLPNRELLRDRAEQAVLAARREHASAAVLAIALDTYSEVVDAFGEAAAERMRLLLTARLRLELREADTIARLAVDEFAVLLPSTDAAGAERVAADLLQSLERPFVLGDKHVEIGASIGVAAYPEHADGADALFRRAEAALRAAKRAPNTYVVYSPSHEHDATFGLALRADLRQAIEEHQLVLHYQPVVDLRTRRAIGVEALVRWQHPQRGLVVPHEVIPLAERTGLIRPLTDFVLDDGMRQSARWREGAGLCTWVNLSVRNVLDPRLVAAITAMLERSGVPAHSIGLEITESVLMAEPERARRTLDGLRDMGIRLAIDDFGTGYSALAYLQQLPVSTVKIDRSFVRRMTRDDNSAAIVRATIDLSHDLGFDVIAEGVEDEATFDLLLSLGCDAAQGFFIARPAPAAETERWLAQMTRAAASPPRHLH